MPEEGRRDAIEWSVCGGGVLPTTLHRGDRFGGADDFVVASEDEAVREMPARGRAISEGKWRVQRASLDLLASLDEEMARRKLDYDALACVASPDVETLRGNIAESVQFENEEAVSQTYRVPRASVDGESVEICVESGENCDMQRSARDNKHRSSSAHSRRLVHTCSSPCLLVRVDASHTSLRR